MAGRRPANASKIIILLNELEKIGVKFAKKFVKMTFFAISVFRGVYRKIRPKYFGQFDRNFGRNFGFGRTLVLGRFSTTFAESLWHWSNGTSLDF